METESTVDTRTVERTAVLTLVRVVDFEKIAEESGGSVSVEAIRTAGNFVVIVEPNGRDAKAHRVNVADEDAGANWLDGFEACAALKRKKPRTPKTPAEKAAAKKKRETAAKKAAVKAAAK